MDLAFLVESPGAALMADSIKFAHSRAWSLFFKSLGFKDAPETVKRNLQVNVDQIWRKEPTLWVDNHVDYIHLPPESHPPDGYLL